MTERLPGMDLKDLATLRANAVRLQSSGAPNQQAAATDLLPLIDAELAGRKAKAPAATKSPRKTKAKAG
ncbi:hypothetical protein [Caulobacter sp. 17J65-9]|uniref:hypothetical protein n=1 Tax=Caulobacter sp. 17J65-9 TaxID=2709382 RepID=UPI0013C85FEA|nr:hypothetical protein [Caulobacter sp. 17J65-9]NEX94341.1 hypothetical protein [Caulobacter sp. 17J65-9]